MVGTKNEFKKEIVKDDEVITLSNRNQYYLDDVVNLAMEKLMEELKKKGLRIKE